MQAISHEGLLGAVNPAQFDALVRQHYKTIYSYSLRLTGNNAEAEDLTQETFVRAFYRRELYDPNRPFRAWLQRIAHNLFIDQVRHNRTRQTVSLETMLDSSEEGMNSALDIPDDRQNPERVLMEETLDEGLACALRGLPMTFRTPITLCDVEGLSYEEIAQRLNCTLGTVRSRIHRGRLLLREALSPVRNEGSAYRLAA